LLTEQRRTQIASLVDELGAVTNEELANRFGVSLMTIWRDLTGLEGGGRLRRVRGGAVRVVQSHEGGGDGAPEGAPRPRFDLRFDPRLEPRADLRPEAEPFYVSKQVVNQDKKDRIARFAADHFLADGDIIFMEAGTTVAAMARHLPAYKHLTVVGNGLGTMNELAAQLPDITVFCCGGMLREVGLTFVGPQAEAYFRQINAHTCFLSATGITTAEGVTDPNLLEIQVKRAMAHSAGRIVLLMDSTKFGTRSLARIFDVRDVDVLITDAAAPGEVLAEIAALGVQVHVAS
jgi:DeoR/GlpR family transcriptional regulator of sugar metabolism